MRNFNLLVSTSRFNENNAKAELWFTLLMCEDQYPIISNLEYLGLITALTNLKIRDFISKIKEILRKDPDFFQYILKIVPIDHVCETSINVITEIVQAHYRKYIEPTDSFRIYLKHRKNKLIDRDILIRKVAKDIDNRVDLENPDKVIRIEVLGNFTGISFIKPDDVIKKKPPTNSFN